jgi:hypothetical protein
MKLARLVHGEVVSFVTQADLYGWGRSSVLSETVANPCNRTDIQLRGQDISCEIGLTDEAGEEELSINYTHQLDQERRTATYLKSACFSVIIRCQGCEMRVRGCLRLQSAMPP